MDPPTWVPKAIKIPKKKGFIHQKDFFERKAVKGRVRISGFQYVSPSRSKRHKHTMWRVRYNRKGVVFCATYKCRELCGYIAAWIHELADPELTKGRYPTNRFCSLPYQKEGKKGDSLVWVFGADPQTIVRVDTSKLEKIPKVPWFFLKGKGIAATPVVKLTEKGKIEVYWTQLERELFPDSWERRHVKNPPEENAEGQIVHDRTIDNFITKTFLWTEKI